MNYPTILTTLAGGFCALLMSAVVGADVYRSVDADGNVTYSDTPHSGAEKIEVQEPTIIPSTRSQIKLGPDKSAKQAVPYTSIAIASPANEETLRNVRTVSVQGQLPPSLQTSFGHRVQILFNGSPVTQPSASLSATLNDVERGAHTLELVVVDRRGTEIARSPASTFFLHQTSVRGAN